MAQVLAPWPRSMWTQAVDVYLRMPAVSSLVRCGSGVTGGSVLACMRRWLLLGQTRIGLAFRPEEKASSGAVFQRPALPTDIL